MQRSIDVQVYKFEREGADQSFTETQQREFSTVVNDSSSYELPMCVLTKDARGNTLSYIACKVEPSAKPKIGSDVAAKKPVATKAEPVAKKPVAKKSVAKKPATVDHGPSNEVIAKTFPSPKPTTAHDDFVASFMAAVQGVLDERA